MSIFNSLTTAVSGMDAQSTAFTNLGNNIANSQTVGYKADTTAFQDFVSGSTGAGDFTQANADSVSGLTAQHVDRQGQTTDSMDSLAMAINGDGMFNVAKSAGQATSGVQTFQGGYYTRNGEFYEDKNGYLVNPAGYYLEGYMTDKDGILDPTNLTQINVKNNTQFRPTETHKIYQNAILPSDYVPGQGDSYNTNKKSDKNSIDPQSFQTQPVTTYDSAGKPHQIALSWQQSQFNPLDWTVQAYSADGTEKVNAPTYNVTFDNEGHMKSISKLQRELKNPPSSSSDLVKKDSSGNAIKDANGNEEMMSIFKSNDGHYYETSTVGNNLPDEPVNLDMTVTPTGGRDENTQINLGSLGSTSGTTLKVSNDTQASSGSTLPTLTNTGSGNLKLQSHNGAADFSIGDATSGRQNFMTAPTKVYDSSGNATNVAIQFTERSPAEQTWTARVIDLDNGEAVSKSVAYTPKSTNETWTDSNPNENQVALVPASGDSFSPTGNASKIGFSSITNPPSQVNLSVNEGSTPNVLTTDSVASGNFEKAEIGSDGSIVGVYDNGDTQLIGKVALTKFPDVNGLTAVDGQAYMASTQSGTPNTGMVGQNGTGDLSVGYVESSTTNLTSDLSNLIVAQEAYSANTKTVTTADELLQTTIAMKQS